MRFVTLIEIANGPGERLCKISRRVSVCAENVVWVRHNSTGESRAWLTLAEMMGVEEKYRDMSWSMIGFVGGGTMLVAGTPSSVTFRLTWSREF